MNSNLLNKSNKSTNREEASWIDRLKLAILVALIYLILNVFEMGCPLRFFTGISCPGCGMTRAVLSAIRLNFPMALHFHPLVFLVPLMFIIYLFGYRLKPQYVKSFWIIITVLFIGVYIYRLTFAYNDIVSIDINNGIVLKFIQNNILGG